MPRRAFVADLQETIRDFRNSSLSNLTAGEEDGTILFDFKNANSHYPAIIVQAIIPDVSEYPSSHQYLLCTPSQHVPAAISSVLADTGDLSNSRLPQMLSKMLKKLDKAADPTQMDLDVSEFGAGSENEDEDFADEENSEPESFTWSYPSPPSQHTNCSSTTQMCSENSAARKVVNRRIRQDLRAVKEAGFRLSLPGKLLNGSQEAFLSVSCRISKLGISDEALQAWHMDSNHYFLLLIRYSPGYRSLERLTSDEAFVSGSVEMRVGTSQTYKVNISQAVDAFNQIKGKTSGEESLEIRHPNTSTGLLPLFIGRPLNELLNERLIAILKYRLSYGFSWGGAETYYNDHQGKNTSDLDISQDKYLTDDDTRLTTTIPPLVTADHLAQPKKLFSFPLLAMQFALRHLVRCTEFCLVCHCRVEEDFEALKPYVCSKPLCLYQYMALGFGPSIEHEILSQPHVVDLLVSFCYSSAHDRKLSSLPVGMGLAVPWPTKSLDAKLNRLATKADDRLTKSYHAKLDITRNELILAPGEKILHSGQWIVLTLPWISDEQWHCRVLEALHPTIRLSSPIIVINTKVERSIPVPPNKERRAFQDQDATARLSYGSALTPNASPRSFVKDDSSYREISFCVYDHNLDDFTDVQKQTIICNMLDTLPNIGAMKTFLQGSKGRATSLRDWIDRISPAALGILRWIIASNRSCIIQVDSLDYGVRKFEERVSDMTQWMQFRFAMGAPDKEQRFINSIRETTGSSPYPTIFAWHGSPLPNWHGIVREGLHYNYIANGRAYGNGVYHALHAQTSVHYSNTSGRQTSSSFSDEQFNPGPGSWPHSELHISEALVLNEIVNAPAKFVHTIPYLVVSQLDWIQSRYLFVKCNVGFNNIEDKAPTQVYGQDPRMTPKSHDGKPIMIPITAIPRSRRPQPNSVKIGNKKVKIDPASGSGVDNAILLSDDTDFDDIEMLISDDDEASPKPSDTLDKAQASIISKSSQMRLETPITDFIPGTLDYSTLPILTSPSYATLTATNALSRELRNTLQIQKTHPIHELGWYIDAEHIQSLYQWIVELHSFDSNLPLTNDMKAKNLRSIILELRFGKEYPISPPFVRVIRPRFLSFMQGGGGHVTAGGALCMELLTNNGWSAVSNTESVLLQIRMALSSTDPRPARLEPGPVRDYSVSEAVEAFVRACKAHGWQVPRDFYSTYQA